MATPSRPRQAPQPTPQNDPDRPPLRKRLLFIGLFVLIALLIVGGTVALVWGDIQGRLNLPRREPVGRAEGVSVSTFTTLSEARAFPNGLAQDGDDLIVTLFGTGAVDRLGPDGTRTNFQQLTAPGAIARGPDGAWYVIDYLAPDSRTFGRLKRIAPDGEVSYFGEALNADGLPLLAQLAVDSAGNVYVSHPDQGEVWRVLPDGSAGVWWSVPAVGGVTGQPVGLAYEAPRNALLVVDPATGSIYRLALDAAVPTAETLYRQAGLDLRGVVADAADRIYVLHWAADNGVLSRLEADGVLLTLADNFRAPTALVARDGGLYIVNSDLPALITQSESVSPFTIDRVQLPTAQ